VYPVPEFVRISQMSEHFAATNELQYHEQVGVVLHTDVNAQTGLLQIRV